MVGLIFVIMTCLSVSLPLSAAFHSIAVLKKTSLPNMFLKTELENDRINVANLSPKQLNEPLAKPMQQYHLVTSPSALKNQFFAGRVASCNKIDAKTAYQDIPGSDLSHRLLVTGSDEDIKGTAMLTFFEITGYQLPADLTRTHCDPKQTDCLPWKGLSHGLSSQPIFS